MPISINDLKGFDFSGKYLNIHEKFFIEKDGKRVDFKIYKQKSYFDDSYEFRIEYEYYTNYRVMQRSVPYKNPFHIFREIENEILKADDKLSCQATLIKNTLSEFNQNFDDWDELTKKLSSKVDILKLYPNYNSSLIPQDLSREDLAKYLDKFSKYELENLFADCSMLDFEIFYQNVWGEDYEYLIRKAFTSHFLGEELFSHVTFDVINKKRREFYIGCVLKNHGFNIDEYDLMIPVIDSFINSSFNHGRGVDRRNLMLQQSLKREKIDLKDMDFEKLDKIEQLRNQIYDEFETNYSSNIINFNNLDDSLIKSKYVEALSKISSNSKSENVMRYKIPNENGDINSFQTTALKNEHIKIGNSKDTLSEYTLNELKSVLNKYGLKVGGNKIHLINRIKENLSDEIVNKEFSKKYFSLTEKGQEFLDKYTYLSNIDRVLPPNFTIDEFDLICNSNQDVAPDEILKCLVNEKWVIWDETLGDEPKI